MMTRRSVSLGAIASGAVAAHGRCVSAATSIARFASSTEASAMVLMVLPVAGSATAMLRPEVESTQLPPMKRAVVPAAAAALRSS